MFQMVVGLPDEVLVMCRFPVHFDSDRVHVLSSLRITSVSKKGSNVLPFP